MLGTWPAAQSSARNVIVLPKVDHPRAGLSPAAWRRLSPAEKLERLFEMSLDRMAEIMSLPAAELDPARLNAQVQIARVVLMIGNSAGMLEAPHSERERQAMLQTLERELTKAGASDKGAAPEA